MAEYDALTTRAQVYATTLAQLLHAGRTLNGSGPSEAKMLALCRQQFWQQIPSSQAKLSVYILAGPQGLCTSGTRRTQQCSSWHVFWSQAGSSPIILLGGRGVPYIQAYSRASAHVYYGDGFPHFM